MDIYTTGPTGTHQRTTGTSYAAAHVAAAAALLRARYPHEQAGQIIQRLTSTAGTRNGTRSPHGGYGLIDPHHALTAAAPPAEAANPFLTPAARPAPGPSPKSEPSRTRRVGIIGFAVLVLAVVTGALFYRRRAAAARRQH